MRTFMKFWNDPNSLKKATVKILKLSIYTYCRKKSKMRTLKVNIKYISLGIPFLMFFFKRDFNRLNFTKKKTGSFILKEICSHGSFRDGRWWCGRLQHARLRRPLGVKGHTGLTGRTDPRVTGNLWQENRGYSLD